jgi:hypothetical protein
LNGSDWASAFGDATALTDLYDAIPPLSTCDLLTLLVDERGDSVTIGFETAELPTRPPAEWDGAPYNTVEFALRFTDITDLRISGWDAGARHGITVGLHQDGRIRVRVDRPGTRLSFTASTATVARPRAYLAARTVAGPRKP